MTRDIHCIDRAKNHPACVSPDRLLSVRGLLARSVLQAQAASPIFTHVYAAVVSIINSKFPAIGELILKRLILTFRKSYRRNLKVPPACRQLKNAVYLTHVCSFLNELSLIKNPSVFVLQQQCLTASKFVAHLINQNVVRPVSSL